jgi:hypothetical protein
MEVKSSPSRKKHSRLNKFRGLNSFHDQKKEIWTINWMNSRKPVLSNSHYQYWNDHKACSEHIIFLRDRGEGRKEKVEIWLPRNGTYRVIARFNTNPYFYDEWTRQTNMNLL